MDAFEFLTEALQLISETTVAGVFFGINVSLYFLCTQLFYSQYRKAPPDERRKLAFSFLYNTVMVLSAGMEIAAYIRFMQLAYIDHGGVKGEAVVFESKIQDQFSALNFFFIGPGFIIGTINPLMQVWRIWIIWATSPFKHLVTIFPLILVIVGLSLNIYFQTLSTTAESDLASILGTVILSLNFAVNVLVTLLLVGRILMVRWRNIRLLGTSAESGKQYTNIVAMLIESYALDAGWTVPYMVSDILATEGKPAPYLEIFANAGDQVTVIAFLLVAYRVLLGRAWSQDTGRQLSTMRWNENPAEGRGRQLSTLRWNHDDPEVSANGSTSIDHAP